MNKRNVFSRSFNFIVTLFFLQLVGLTFPGNNLLSAQPLYLGLKGGWSLPSLSGGTNEISRGWSSRSAFNFGVLGYCEISERFSFQTEVNYASQGGKKNGIQPLSQGSIPGLPEGMTFYADFKNQAILNYIEVPLLAKYTLIKTNSQKFSVNAGPYFGYLLNAHNKSAGSSLIFTDKNGSIVMIPNPSNPQQYIPLPEQNFDANVNISSDIKKFNCGLTGGIGASQNLGNGNVFINVQGYYGFINIQKNPINGKNNTGALVVSLGYSCKIN
jgi:hypothetical protein